MAREGELGGAVYPIAGGLRDRLGARGVGPGAASALNRIEHNRLAAEAGRGAVKVARLAPKTAALRLGRLRAANDEAGYVLIPAANRFSNRIASGSDFTLEFFLEIDEIPDTSTDYRTLICHGAPYTSGRLSWELNLIKSATSNAALLALGWTDSGAFSGTNALFTRAWSAELHKRTRYHVRIRFAFEAGAVFDNFELFLDNVAVASIDNDVGGTKRPLLEVNAPIYIGGIGLYPNATSSNKSAQVRIQDLRLVSGLLSASDADVVKYSTEALDPAGTTYAASLLGWWPLDDGGGQIARDGSKYANDGYFGPSLPVVRRGLKAAPGAIFLDGHTSFLQADFRYRDLFREEFLPNHMATAFRYGFTVRCAILDKSHIYAGSPGCRFAELAGEQVRDRPACVYEYDASGFLRARFYAGGALQQIATASEVVPGTMQILDFFQNNVAGNEQHFYIDGELVGSAAFVTGVDQAVRVRVGATADFVSDLQTPWSRFYAGIPTCPLLVEEVRVWCEYLDANGVADRWERTLTDEQILEVVGPETAEVVNGSTTVECSGAVDAAAARRLLVLGDRTAFDDADRQKAIDQPKLYFISSVASPNLTLATPYEGRSSRAVKVRTTRLGGYWPIPSPEDLVAIDGTSQLHRWSEVHPKPTPDEIGDVVETVNGSQAGLMPLIADSSPAEVPLMFGVDPRVADSAPGRMAPEWAAGLAYGSKSPGRALFGYERPGDPTRAILQHHSNAYHVDPRWRRESPFYGDLAPGCLEFFGADEVRVAHAAGLNTGGANWWSLQGWIRHRGGEKPEVVAFKGDDDGTAEINYLIYLQRGRLHLRFATGGNGRDYYTVGKPLRRGRWQKIELTWSGAAFSILVDGTLQTLAFTNVGVGGIVFGASTDPLHIGDVPPIYRNDFDGFRGLMAEIWVVGGVAQPAGVHTADYVPEHERLTAIAGTEILLPMNDLEDARATNATGAAPHGEVRGDPFRAVMEGLGVARDVVVPSLKAFGGRLYGSTGAAPPQVYQGDLPARRMGIVPPMHAVTAERRYDSFWSEDAPAYAGTGASNSAYNNRSVRLYGRQFIRVTFATGAEMNLSGRDDTDNDRDTGAWDCWFRPDRLDLTQVLMGKNFGVGSGNYAIVLIPNAAKTAMKVRFTWYDKTKGGFKYFETNTFPITDTTSWYYLFVTTQFAAAGASREDHIRIVREPVTTGSALTLFSGASLVTTGDLGTNDQPDYDAADVLWGWSAICNADETYHGFHGRIAEIRYTADTDNDANFWNALTGPTASPDNVFRNVPTDAAYETGGAAFAGANSAEVNTASLRLNLNEGHGSSPVDDGAGGLDVALESLDATGADVGLHRFRVTFYDPDTGVESMPGPEFSVEIFDQASVEEAARAWFKLFEVPVSGDRRPDIYRRIYKTPTNGSEFYLAAEIRDNVATGVVVEVLDADLVQSSLMPVRNDYPEWFEVGHADQTRFFFGRRDANGALFSEPFFPEYAPATNLLSLDSENGSVVTAISRIFGQIVLCTWREPFVARELNGGFDVGIVATDGGAVGAGAIVPARDGLYRVAENGVYVFNGAEDAYASNALGRPDGTWSLLDPSFRAVTGVYWRERDQVIWLLKRRADERSRTRLALDLVVGRGAGRASDVFTVSDGPDLAAIGLIRGLDGSAELWGTDHLGMVYRLDQGFLDGPREGFGSRRGLTAGGSTASIVQIDAAYPLDVIGDGHRGETIDFIDAKGQMVSARVRKNGVSSVELVEPLAGIPAAGWQFRIGVYERFWRSGFLPYGPEGQFKKWGDLRANFDRNAHTLVRLRAWTDFDEETAYELGEHPIVEGFLEVSGVSRLVPSGRFLMLEFRARGHFLLRDYTLSAEAVRR